MNRILTIAAGLMIGLAPAAYAQLGGDSSTNFTSTSGITTGGATTSTRDDTPIANPNNPVGANTGINAPINVGINRKGGLDSSVSTGLNGDDHGRAPSETGANGSLRTTP